MAEKQNMDELEQQLEGTMAKKPVMDELQQNSECTVPEKPNMELLREAFEKLGIDFEKNLRFMDHVGKFVKAITEDSKENVGWVKCLDPMSGNFILVTLDDSITQVTGIRLIMGHACKSSEVLKEPTERVTALLANMDNTVLGISAALIPDRKQRLLALIKKHRLPVKEREDKTLVIADDVTVSPPYEVDDCDSPNPRTLRSIRNIVAEMPLSIDEEAARLAKQKEKEKSLAKDKETKDVGGCSSSAKDKEPKVVGGCSSSAKGKETKDVGSCSSSAKDKETKDVGDCSSSAKDKETKVVGDCSSSAI